MKIAKYNIDKDTVKGGKAAVVRVPGATGGGGMVMAEKADYAERAGIAEQAENITSYSSVWDTIDEKDKDVKSFAQKLSDTLRAYVDKSFLSKLQDDTAKGLIQFAQGMQAGDFVGGKFGRGARIDRLGNAEMQSLTVREFIESPEFRFNRISINIGNQWRAPGGGIIESVIPDTDTNGNDLMTGTLTLHLEDGEIGTIEEGDICQGIYHDGMTLANNATDYLDDGIGNFTFPGFYTCYFRIDKIMDTRHRTARYVLRPKSDNYKLPMHPREAMHFVAYGSFTNKSRQKSRYSTRTYERYLTDVNTWEFQANNIAAQFGDLSNLSIFGLNMTGYSAYLNNIYMTGVVEQLLEQPISMKYTDTLGGFMGQGETDTLTFSVYRGWIDITNAVTKWKITRDTADPAEDAAWNLKDKAVNFAGTIELKFDENDLGTNAETAIFNVEAFGNDDKILANAEVAV